MRQPLGTKSSDPNWGAADMVDIIAQAINNYICNGSQTFMKTDALKTVGCSLRICLFYIELKKCNY